MTDHFFTGTTMAPRVGVVAHCSCGWSLVVSCHDAAREAFHLHREQAKEKVQ